jgi:hypothetical protein
MKLQVLGQAVEMLLARGGWTEQERKDITDTLGEISKFDMLDDADDDNVSLVPTRCKLTTIEHELLDDVLCDALDDAGLGGSLRYQTLLNAKIKVNAL